MIPELRTLCQIVITATKEEIQGRFHAVSREFKADGSIVTAADRAMQARLERDLRHHWPDIPLLGEEMDDATQAALLRDQPQGVWCLDPLDGTTNFASGVPMFAVSIALIRDGAPVLGMIYDPIHGECFAAAAGQGAWCNASPVKAPVAPPMRDCLAAIDLKRLSPSLAKYLVYHPPYGSQRNFGSCVLEWAWLATGRVHLYLHGGQALWDYAAGVLLLTEAGGRALTFDGEPVFHAGLVRRSIIAASDPEAFVIWRDYLMEFAARSES
ncbi:myo-inositol-1(or 4)-monophosphatase [Gammaproteobacteria bacterium]